MSKIYKIIGNSLASKGKDELDLVRGTNRELLELTGKMNKITNDPVKTYFTFVDANIEIIDENGELFNVYPFTFDGGVIISSDSYETVKDSKAGIEDKIKQINSAGNIYYEYEKAKVLTPKQAFEKYKTSIQKSNFTSKNDEMAKKVEESEREL